MRFDRRRIHKIEREYSSARNIIIPNTVILINDKMLDRFDMLHDKCKNECVAGGRVAEEAEKCQYAPVSRGFAKSYFGVLH